MNCSVLDFCYFVDYLCCQGDLVDVYIEVDVNLEIGVIICWVYECCVFVLLFYNICDSLFGVWVLGVLVGLCVDRVCVYLCLVLYFGLLEYSGLWDIVVMLCVVMCVEFIVLCWLECGLVQENVWFGEQVDLICFLVFLFYEQDGGCYFGIYGFYVVQMLDGSWDSWLVGWLMLVDCNILVGLIIFIQYIGIICEQWCCQGKLMFWVMVFGVLLVVFVVVGMLLLEGVSEVGYVGVLVGELVEVVCMQINGLWVLVNVEIVLEGEISFDEIVLEGLMGEYYGYFFFIGKLQLLFYVYVLSFCDQLILLICVVGMLLEENYIIWGIMIFV